MTNLIFPNASYESLMRQLEPTGGEVKKIAYKTQAAIDRRVNVAIWHHGHLIAFLGKGFVRLSNAGYHTRTTADRLNRIARDNGVGSVFILDGTMMFRPTEGLEYAFNGGHFVADGMAIPMWVPVEITK